MVRPLDSFFHHPRCLIFLAFDTFVNSFCYNECLYNKKASEEALGFDYLTNCIISLSFKLYASFTAS